MANQVLGIGALQQSFLRLSQNMVTRTSQYMVASSGAVLRKEAKTIAQRLGLKKTGALINNIAIKREKTPIGITQYNLGVRHGRNLTKKGASKLRLKLSSKTKRVVYANDPYYWRFFEFGWIPRGPGRALSGGERKKSALRAALDAAGKKRAATPFIGPALVNKREEAIKAMEEALIKRLDKDGK